MDLSRAPTSAVVVPIASDVDIVTARKRGRDLASQLGYSPTEATVIATAISELARNIVLYAGRGEITLTVDKDSEQQGIVVVARDEGPGVADVSRVVAEGYSSSGGLGLGLPGVRRLMDEFDISSAPGQGTTVTVKKWKR